ncbi:hypothetical protein AHiyo4_07680 [Arthrobacter sp. Hiyo4]|nr:hypothetical protein AHiyo4_07680 [Arthrobacter sp. Hiyo4]
MNVQRLSPAFPAAGAAGRITSEDATRTRSDAGALDDPRSVHGLVRLLQAEGCEVTGAAAYLALLAVQPTAPQRHRTTSLA